MPVSSLRSTWFSRSMIRGSPCMGAPPRLALGSERRLADQSSARGRPTATGREGSEQLVIVDDQVDRRFAVLTPDAARSGQPDVIDAAMDVVDGLRPEERPALDIPRRGDRPGWEHATGRGADELVE